MSSLINNLNSILNTKEEIKEILGTNSEIFADYPAYISEAIASGGASGYAYITENGDHNIATYAMVNVNVPQQEVPVIPDGYTYVFGTKSITDNADGIDISSYAYVDVNVPVPPEYIVPAGYAYITTNGDFDIRDFEAVNVAVPQSSVSGYSYIITNGDFNIAAYEMVNVNVPIPSGYVFPTGTYNIGLNGIYTLPEYAYAYVYVPSEIPAGYAYIEAEPYDTAEFMITKQYDEDNGTYFFVLPTEYEGSYYSGVRLSENSEYNTYSITANGEYFVSPFDFECPNESGTIGYMRTNISVAVPIPAGYTYVSGAEDIPDFNLEQYIVSSGNVRYLNIPSTEYSYVRISENNNIGTYNIIDNGEYYFNVLDEGCYFRNTINVAVPTFTPEGTKEILVNHSETGIDVYSYAYVDVELPGDMFAVSYDPQVTMTYLDTVVSSDVDSDGNIYITLQDINDEGTSTFAVNPRVTDNESQKGQWSYQISQNGDYEIDVRETGYFVNPIHVAVTPSVSGTYYATENGTYDISAYEYVDVNVQGSGGISYTWNNLALSGNLKVYHASDVYWNDGVSLGISYTSGGGWLPHTDYYQIISGQQFGYILPTEITGTQMTDWDTTAYTLTSWAGCTYTCDPSDWDNMTNILDAGTGSTNYCYSYVVTAPDVYYMNSSSGHRVYPWGGNVHSMEKLTQMPIMRWHEAESEYEEPWGEEVGHLDLFLNGGTDYYAYMTRWSYFGGEETDIRNLAGQDWKVVIEKYQERYMLKDIVGPVAGSEHYMEECNDIWANWNGGWNGSTYTMSYNSSTGCIEMEYVKNIYTSSVQSTFNLYQLEYKIDADGTARRIRCNADNVPTASLNNLSGTTYLSVVPKISSSNPECDVLYMDSDFGESTTYTNYTVDLKLCIPHDMWIYGSSNHDKMWVEWTVTPDDTPLPAESVTAMDFKIGTNSYSASTVNGSDDGNGNYVASSTKSGKSPSSAADYKLFRLRATGSQCGQISFTPDITSAPTIDSTHLSGTTTFSCSEGSISSSGLQWIVVDATELENAGISNGNLTWEVTVPSDFFDNSSQNYHKVTVDWEYSIS